MDSFFMPHGHCYLWQPGLVWLQAVTNASIGIAYVAIAAMLAYLVHKGQYVPFRGMALAFGIFIVSCGMTHFLDVYVIWDPIYWTDGIVRAITAVASVGTALMLPPLIPRAIALARGAKRAQERGIELETALEEMETAYERARELERMKTEFFANVSHELRTPLALILGPAQRLMETGALDERQRGDVDLIQRNARTLLKHVNDLLDVSRFEAGKLEPSYVRTDLAKTVRTVAGNFDGLAADRKMSFRVEAPETLDADVDADKIQRILLNLLSNAFKFTPSSGTVRCTLTVREDRGERGEVVIEVADSGPGIAAQHRERVFDRFGQLDASATRRFGGTGLGLAIAKDFATVHGGTIDVDDAAEGGALLRVVIPRRAPAGATVAEHVAEVEAVRSEAEIQAIEELEARVNAMGRGADHALPLVLVVEDNPDMNRFVAETLEADYRVERALDGKAGLVKTRELRPDLIVSDIMMPEMSGDQLVREVRRDATLDATPILLLTAKADEDLRIELLREGAQDYVMKPFDADELRARARNLVIVKRARDALQRALESQTHDLERLAEEVTQRTLELQTTLDAMRVAKDHAERASQLKSDFLGMVSHELRTPLSTLMLQLERMRLDEERLGSDERHLIDRMSVQASRLHDLIESLLEHARIQAGRLPVRIEPVDVPALVTECISELRPHAEAKQLKLETHVETEVGEIRSDGRLVRLILMNLAGNAVKFTDDGSVRVEVRREGGDLVLRVSDTGPGIPRHEHEKVFEPFRQLGQPRHKHLAGVGLGLSLVRDMTGALGGTVAMDSTVGHGTIFTVRIPLVTMRGGVG